MLASELQAAIQRRASSDKPVGTKQRKQKGDRGGKKPVQLSAADVSIPDGVFIDTAGNGLSQIAFGCIGSQASGIVVLSAR